jgi:hypothetical protein
MAASTDTREAEVHRLHGLPLAQFTAARDDLAKRLRSEGDREGAKEITRLRKPTAAAWALNQVSRDDPRGVDELIVAGQRLRDGQERLLAAGDREPLDRATAQERQLVKDLARHAERQLVGAGQSVSAAVQSKLWATLRAVAVDSEARELISAGRLVRDYEISDLGLGFAQAQTPRASPAEAPPPPRSDAAADAALARKIRGVRQRLERSRARALEIEQKLEDARRDVEDARREAARAASVLDRAQATAEQARVSAQDTTGRVTELEATLLELESRSRA